MKKWISCLLLMVLTGRAAVAETSGLAEEGVKADPARQEIVRAAEKTIELPGLSVDAGQLELNGTPYRGMGANYFSLFYRTLKDPSDRSYEEGLNTKEKSWKRDTRPQYERILLRDNPDPFNVISIHVYKNDGQGNTKSISETVALSQEISVRAGKPLFIGEFGAPKTLGMDEERALFQQMLDAIEASKVPLSAFWVFDHPEQYREWNATFENERSYMLKLVAASNQRIQRTHSPDKSTQQAPAGDVLKAAPEE